MTVGTPQLNGSTPGNASTISGGANGDDLRPKRQKKRRRYDEGSYEGYEGYDDEDTGTNAGSGPGGGNWDGEQNKKKKKRKKACISFGICSSCRHLSISQRWRLNRYMNANLLEKQNPDSPGMELGRHGVPVQQSSMIYGR